MKIPERTSSAFGLLELFIASLIRGFQGFFVRVTEWTPHHTWPLAFFRLSIPAVLMYFYLLLSGRRVRGVFTRHMLPLHLTSLLTSLRMLFFFLGYEYADISSATLIFFASGIFTVILEPLFLKEKFSFYTFLLAVLAFFGIFFILRDAQFSFENKQFLGLVAMALSSFLVIFENMGKKKFVQRATNYEWVFYQGFLSSLILSLTLFFFPLPNLHAFLWILLFAVVIGIVPFMLDTSSLRKARVSDLAIVRYTEPIAAMGVGFLLFHEPFTLNKVLGALCIFAAVYLVFRKQRHQ